jgi:hypothetical protein
MKFAAIAVVIVLGIARPLLAPHTVSLQGSYEARAHLFVGGVIGAWVITCARWLLAIAIGLTAVEVGSTVIGLMF